MAERPAAFRVSDRWEWITCDDAEFPELAGFAVEVRTSITNREQEDLQDAHNAILDYNAEWLRMEPAERAKADAANDTPRDREWALVAPMVRDWNAVGLDPDGNDVPIPPPAEAGPQTFMAVPAPAVAWITRVTLMGYRATGKAGGLPTPSTPTSGPRIVSGEG